MGVSQVLRPASRRVARSAVAAGLAATCLMIGPDEANAQAEPFLGQMMLVGYSFCPRGWAPAEGQIMAIAQNTALFSLLGTTFGGDGRTTFALPDLRGRVVVGQGRGPGLPAVQVGERGGNPEVNVSVAQMPAHTHGAATTVDVTSTLRAASADADAATPAGRVLADGDRTNLYHGGPVDTDMAADAVQSSAAAETTVEPAGEGQSIDVRSPFLGMRWCIALQGIFPSRN